MAAKNSWFLLCCYGYNVIIIIFNSLAQSQLNCFFVPVACEPLDVFGAESLFFLKDLGHRLHQTTGDSPSYQFLLQRLSVAIQRGIVTSFLRSLSYFDGLDDF